MHGTANLTEFVEWPKYLPQHQMVLVLIFDDSQNMHSLPASDEVTPDEVAKLLGDSTTRFGYRFVI